MAFVKLYKTYPIHRDRDGTYCVVTGKTAEGSAITQGQFDSVGEAEAFVEELLAGELAKFMGQPPPTTAAG